MSPSEVGLKLYISLLLKTYNQKMGRLNKIRAVVDEEIRKPQSLRQSLVKKNLSGLYSDEIFREQNTVIEKKIIAA